jgi:hypothetical protein
VEQLSVAHCQLVDGADEVVDVGPQLCRLFGILLAEFLQFDDLLAQTDLGVRLLSQRPDPRVEVVLVVRVALGQRVAGYAGFVSAGLGWSAATCPSARSAG